MPRSGRQRMTVDPCRDGAHTGGSGVPVTTSCRNGGWSRAKQLGTARTLLSIRVPVSNGKSWACVWVSRMCSEPFQTLEASPLQMKINAARPLCFEKPTIRCLGKEG